MSVSFSLDGSAAISRQVKLPTSSSQRNIHQYYDIGRCLEFIASDASFRKIALQFPDQLLCDSVAVVTILSRESGRECFILGDTSYGSCCVDEVAASHVTADCIIHYGPSCLTQTSRLPVFYVFGREEIQLDECAEVFKTFFPDQLSHVVILYDTIYHHCIDELKERLNDYPNLVPSLLSLPHSITPSHSTTSTPSHSTSTYSSCTTDDRHSKCDNVKSSEDFVTELTGVCCYNRFGRSFKLDKPVDKYSVFYIGHEGQTLNNLIISYSQTQFYSYNPLTSDSRRESVSVNKTLGRRYYLVQKAKEASTVGILIGTLGAIDNLKVIERLKSILKRSGKKYYTIAVGKLNAAKMANFMEIDIFVLVACPENSLIESQEYYRPVVTPFEMEVACLRDREWTGDMITDYCELFSLPLHEEDTQNKEEDEPEFSLISGNLLPATHHMTTTVDVHGIENDKEESSTVAVRANMDIALPNSAAEYLTGRSWKGLEKRLGEVGVVTAVEGRRGVASAYSHEHNFTTSKTET